MSETRQEAPRSKFPVTCRYCGRHFSELSEGNNGMRWFTKDLRERWCNDRSECGAIARRKAFRIIDGGRRAGEQQNART